MGMKRGQIILFSIIFLLLIIGFVSAAEENLFSKVGETFRKIFSTMTGWVTDLANVALQIQLDLRAPTNLTITINNQSTGVATLNWTYSNAQGYYIWYSNNITEILQLNYSNTNISNVSSPNVTLVGKYNTTWNDTNAASVDATYYAVAAYTSDGDIFTTSDTKVAKWNITIYGENNIQQTLMSTPLEQNISISEISPPNDFSWMYGVNHSANDTWDYAYSLSGSWFGTFNEFKFGYGYLLDDFSTEQDITSAGPIPTGNVTQTIYGEDNIKQTLLSWQSISTNGNYSQLITPPNDFSWIYTVDHTANDTWDYAYSLSGGWFGTFSEFEAGSAYLLDDFSTATNITYERNPY